MERVDMYCILVRKLVEQRNMEDLSINGVMIKDCLPVVNAVMNLGLPYNPGCFLSA
jgi:hypothetical protein